MSTARLLPPPRRVQSTHLRRISTSALSNPRACRQSPMRWSIARAYSCRPSRGRCTARSGCLSVLYESVAATASAACLLLMQESACPLSMCASFVWTTFCTLNLQFFFATYRRFDLNEPGVLQCPRTRRHHTHRRRFQSDAPLSGRHAALPLWYGRMDIYRIILLSCHVKMNFISWRVLCFCIHDSVSETMSNSIVFCYVVWLPLPRFCSFLCSSPAHSVPRRPHPY